MQVTWWVRRLNAWWSLKGSSGKERNIEKREARTGKKAQRPGGQDLFNFEKEIHTTCIFPVYFGLIETSEI